VLAGQLVNAPIVVALPVLGLSGQGGHDLGPPRLVQVLAKPFLGGGDGVRNRTVPEVGSSPSRGSGHADVF
jgi:hypothetical protein